MTFATPRQRSPSSIAHNASTGRGTRNTVRRYLRDEAAARYKGRPPRPGKLDPFKGYVVERLAAAAPERIPASVLLGELRERGYAGGYTMLKEFVAGLTPAPPHPTPPIMMPRLVRLIRQLWDSTDAYRSVYFAEEHTRDKVRAEPRAILEAAGIPFDELCALLVETAVARPAGSQR